MAVEVRDAIDDLSLLWPDLGLLKEPFDADVVVSREDKDRDAAPDRIEDTRDLSPLLPGERRDAVLDVTQEDRPVRICRIDGLHEPVEAFGAVAFEMHSMRGEIGLDPEMEVGNDEQALGVLDDKRRAVPDKLQFHNGFTYPFWGW